MFPCSCLTLVVFTPRIRPFFFPPQHPLNVKKLYTWLFHPCCLVFAKMIGCFACEILMVETFAIFFSYSPALFSPSMCYFKSCSGRKKPVSRCGWQEWGENWMYGLRLQEMVVYVAPLVLRGLQDEALNSKVLTHYSLEQRTSENTGVRSTELVVSFTVYFWRNKLWHSTPRVAEFYLPERPLGWCVF